LFSVTENPTGKRIKETLVEIHSSLNQEAMRLMLEGLIVLVDFYEEATDKKVFGTWAKLKARILNLPESGLPILLLNQDARRLSLHDEEVDFVVTSPP
jgi:hypothetical protein